MTGRRGECERVGPYIIYRQVSLWFAFAGGRGVWEGTGCGEGAALEDLECGGSATLADTERGRMVMVGEGLIRQMDLQEQI